MDYRNEDHFRDPTKMVEYVSRQAVQELIYEQQAFYENERKKSDDYGSEMECVGSLNALTAMEDGLSDIPAADVRPVVYGEWDSNDCCTNCGEEADYNWERGIHFYPDFCPHCGADMRGEKERNNG